MAVKLVANVPGRDASPDASLGPWGDAEPGGVARVQ